MRFAGISPNLTSPGDIKATRYQKFEEVNKNTTIYFMKTSAASHMLFDSDETAIVIQDEFVSCCVVCIISPTLDFIWNFIIFCFLFLNSAIISWGQ